MNALIIVAIVLVALGLLITVILWLRTPGSAESEYVTVAELQARLEHEHEPDEQAAAEPAERDGIETGESAPAPESEEPAKDDESTIPVRSEVSTRPGTGATAAEETTAGADDEPEVLGRPEGKAGEAADPESAAGGPSEKPDRNH